MKHTKGTIPDRSVANDKIPMAAQDYFRDNRQILFPEGDSRWMALADVRKAVIAGEAHDWLVYEIDFDTAEAMLTCPYCATGADHVNDDYSEFLHEPSGTLH